MAKAPANPVIPPLVDLPNAPEIFVSEVVGAGVVGGCVSINLASHRWTVAESGTEPEFSRVTVARLVLSGDAAIQLAQHLAKLSSQVRKADNGAEKKPAQEDKAKQ